MIIIYLILIATFIYAVANKSRRTLHMLQQNLYNENNRYLKWVFNNKRQFLCLDIILICISLIGIFVVFDLSFVSTLSMILIFLILIGYTWDKKIKNDQNKKKLVITARIKRLIFTTTILYIIPVIFLIFDLNNIKLAWKILFAENIMLYLNAFIVFIAMLINTPVEKGVYIHYKRKAQNKFKYI